MLFLTIILFTCLMISFNEVGFGKLYILIPF